MRMKHFGRAVITPDIFTALERAGMSLEGGSYGPLHRGEDGTLWPLTSFNFPLRARLLGQAGE